MAVKEGKIRTYSGENLARIAFPLGGMGAGMICLDGTGGFSAVSLRHKPEVFHAPWIFAGLCVKGKTNRARIVEGPTPSWKVMFPWGQQFGGSASGSGDKLYGLPHFRGARFSSRFPFGTVSFDDPGLPVKVELTGWSPFVPGDAESASLPVAVLEYEFANPAKSAQELVFSLHSRNFIHAKEGRSGVRCRPGGYVMWQEPAAGKPWLAGECAVSTDAEGATVDGQWFRGGWFDTKTRIWKNIASGAVVDRPAEGDGEKREGASIYVPLRLRAGERRTVRIRIAWYVPQSDLRVGYDSKEETTATSDRYKPWYAGRFSSLDDIGRYWAANGERLRAESAAFTGCFYDTTLPGEVVEAVAANLSILKSPTVYRQTDGRLWMWEGCHDCDGCCHGSCTHVWNYAQALPHLFPELERTLRATEFNENQDDRGHQNFRAKLPIAANDHGFHAAADGQLGGIMKTYRDWRICGDDGWLRSIWPRVRRSLDYCIETWDPRQRGVLEEPHHNTYDIEFWGPDGMCTSFYLGALKAAVLMGAHLGEEVAAYEALLKKGRSAMERELYNGQYFVQKVVWKGLNAADPVEQAAQGLGQNYSPEALELLEKEGPKYQYGAGCLSDGILGEWMARVCGVGEILDAKKIASHLRSVYRHNFKKDLSTHANPQRPTYALNDEGGLILCTWPRGGALSLPFPYSDEVWTGIEYQVASHLMLIGETDMGREIVRAARARYDGRTRNPYDEFECGHWYGRALSSYGMLQGLTGVRYDAVEKTLEIKAGVKDGLRCFLSTATGFGTVVVKKGKVMVEVKRGTIDVREVRRLPSRRGKEKPA